MYKILSKTGRLCGLLAILTFPLHTSAQQATCDAIYRQALNDFSAGRLDRVVSGLSECAGNRNNSRPSRREMLSLLAMVYTYLDEDENAEKAYLDLLELDPFHSPGTDAPELAYLSERFVTYPKFSFYVFGGANLYTRPDIVRAYAAPEVTVQSINYSRNREDAPGTTFGFTGTMNVFHPQLDLGIGYAFSTMNFRYNARLDNALQDDGIRGPARLTFFEQHRWSQIPVFLNYRFLKTSHPNRTQLIPHVYAGLSIDRMHQSSARLIAPTIQFDQTADETSVGVVLLKDLRNSFNTSFLAGAGIKIHRKGFFFGIDVHYSRMLRNLTDPKTRYSNESLISTFNYVDSDFRLDRIAVQAGIGCFFFRAKRKYAP